MENHTYATHQLVVNVRLEINGGPLGITLSGSEDSSKPILISAIIENGIAEASRQILIGDCLLAINGESVQGKPLSHATKLLQNLGNIVDLKISRNINGTILQLLRLAWPTADMVFFSPFACFASYFHLRCIQTMKTTTF